MPYSANKNVIEKIEVNARLNKIYLYHILRLLMLSNQNNLLTYKSN